MNQLVRIGSADPFSARFTGAEFLRMAECGAFADMKVELIDEELQRMNPPRNARSGRQASVMIRLSRVVPEGLLRGGLGLRLDADMIVACDVALLKRPIADNRLLVPEEILLVVEMAETTISRDLGVKRTAYGRAGIPRYWVVDGEQGVTHVFGRPDGGKYADETTVRFGDPLAVPGTDATITID